MLSPAASRLSLPHTHSSSPVTLNSLPPHSLTPAPSPSTSVFTVSTLFSALPGLPRRLPIGSAEVPTRLPLQAVSGPLSHDHT